MVKNKGFLPSGPSEIPIQRNQIKEIIYSLLPACKDSDTDTGVPFKADAIIANPPAYGRPLNLSLFLCSLKNVLLHQPLSTHKYMPMAMLIALMQSLKRGMTNLVFSICPVKRGFCFLANLFYVELRI